jgi:hypothetical protein
VGAGFFSVEDPELGRDRDTDSELLHCKWKAAISNLLFAIDSQWKVVRLVLSPMVRLLRLIQCL